MREHDAAAARRWLGRPPPPFWPCAATRTCGGSVAAALSWPDRLAVCSVPRSTQAVEVLCWPSTTWWMWVLPPRLLLPLPRAQELTCANAGITQSFFEELTDWKQFQLQALALSHLPPSQSAPMNSRGCGLVRPRQHSSLVALAAIICECVPFRGTTASLPREAFDQSAATALAWK